jgi:hypothetical protein
MAICDRQTSLIAGWLFAIRTSNGDVVCDPSRWMFIPTDWQQIHNVINQGRGRLKLYTIYSAPNHPAGTVRKTKAEAAKAEEEHHSR